MVERARQIPSRKLRNTGANLCRQNGLGHVSFQAVFKVESCECTGFGWET